MRFISVFAAFLLPLSFAKPITLVLPDPRQGASDQNVKITKRQSAAVLGGMDFADPTLLHNGDTIYAFSTTGNGFNIQMASIPFADFDTPGQSWTYIDSDALPSLPPWTRDLTTWAPEVAQFTAFDNSFGLYYAAKTTTGPNGGVHCLGLARNLNSITGPYTDGSSEPWMNAQGFECQVDQGGQIDPALFVDKDGSWYIIYKIDGGASCPANSAPGTGVCGGQSLDYVAANCPSTPIMMHKLGTNPDGFIDGYVLDQSSEWPMTLFDNNGADDGYNIEAPSLVLSDDGETYFMFFSRGCYNGGNYTVSYTYSTGGITGPWTNPRYDLLSTGSNAADGSELYAPGGADVTLLNAQMVFHADSGDTDGHVRAMHTGTLQWLDNYQVGLASD